LTLLNRLSKAGGRRFYVAYERLAKCRGDWKRFEARLISGVDHQLDALDQEPEKSRTPNRSRPSSANYMMEIAGTRLAGMDRFRPGTRKRRFSNPDAGSGCRSYVVAANAPLLIKSATCRAAGPKTQVLDLLARAGRVGRGRFANQAQNQKQLPPVEAQMHPGPPASFTRCYGNPVDRAHDAFLAGIF